LCGSRNYPYYPHGRSLEIPRGREDLKAKLLEGKYEAKLESPGGCGGAKQKNLPWGEYGYFLELHIPGKQQDTGTQLAMPLCRCPFPV